MSLISWRYLDASGQPQGQTYYVEFDSVTVEEFTRSAEVSDYPIESGAILSDHYQPLPYQIRVNGVVSDTPLRPKPEKEGLTNIAPLPPVSGFVKELDSPAAARRREGLSVIRPVVSLPSARLVRGNIERARLEAPQFASVLHFTQPVTRVVDVFRVIDGLMETRTPVSIVMFDDVEFTDMMIIDHRAPRVAGSGGSVEFSLFLRHVQSAYQATTKAAQKRAEPKHAQKKDGGKKKPKPAPAVSKQSSDIIGVYQSNIRQVPNGYVWVQ